MKKLLILITIFIALPAIAEELSLDKKKALESGMYQYLYHKTGTVPVAPIEVSFGGGLKDFAKPGEKIWEIRFNTSQWTEDILFYNPRTNKSCVAHWGKDWEKLKDRIGDCKLIEYKGFE